MKGLLKVFNLKLAQKKKVFIDEAKGDYYYNLGFTDGEELLLITAGKKADAMILETRYDLGLDYLDKKLKLRDFEECASASDVAYSGLDKKGGKPTK